MFKALHNYFRPQNASPESPLSKPHQWLLDLFGNQTYTGVSIDEESALRSSAVYACVSLISQSIASLPVGVVQKNGNRREPSPDHPVHTLIHDSPNSYMSPSQFYELLLTHVLLGGNAYAVIGRDQSNRPLDLNPVPNPRQVIVERMNSRNVYRVPLLNGGEERFDQANVIHLSGLGFDGLMGLSPIAYAAKQAIGLHLAAEEHGARLFSNGARVAGVLKHPKTLTEPAQQRLRDSWANLYAGVGNAGRTALLEEGLDFQQLQMSNEDAQFLESRRFQVEDISRFFRVPLHMINETSKSTSWGSGIEQLSLGFVQFTLRPWLVRIEQELNRKLLRNGDRLPTAFSTKFSIEGLLRGDSTARANFYGSAHTNGWMTPNEIRALEDLAPISSPAADELYVQTNLQPISLATTDAERNF